MVDPEPTLLNGDERKVELTLVLTNAMKKDFDTL
jgi:hypothetical protein